MLTIKERKLVLNWNQKGKTQQEIAELLDCHQSTISRLLEKHKRKGTVANLPRSGRPTPLTKIMLSKLKTRIAKVIREANKGFCAVSTKQVAEIIEHERTGVLVYPGNPESIAWGVNRVLSDPGFSRWIKENARKKVREVYSWDAIAEKTATLYREVAET